MSTYASFKANVFARGVSICVVCLALTASVAAQQNAPDFSSNDVGWVAAGDLIGVPGGPPLVGNDPHHPYIPNGTGKQPTYRIADLTNPNLKPWVKERMKRDNDEVLAGKIGYTPRSSCKPAGVPGFMAMGGGSLFVIQSPKEVMLVFDGNLETRHIYLNVPHATNSKPSWYGDSVGYYEGDTLVVD